MTDFRFVESQLIKGGLEVLGLSSFYSTEDAETLAFILEDSVVNLHLTLYYTAFEDSNTIATFTKLENIGRETAVIHKNLSLMADLPAGTYDVISLQGAYAREKTVRRHKIEQGIFKIASNRGTSDHAQTPSLILYDDRDRKSVV